MIKPVEQVGYSKKFRMIPDDKQIYHVCDGVSPGKEHKDGTKAVSGITVCVSNIKGDQKLLPWGTMVEEIN